MKTYDEQNYTHSQKVLITLEIDGIVESFEDEIKGLNKGHALYRARWNWENAIKIETI